MSDLTDDDKAIVAKLLREMIAADRFPAVAARLRWQAILDKLEPPAPRAGASETASARATLGVLH